MRTPFCTWSISPLFLLLLQPTLFFFLFFWCKMEFITRKCSSKGVITNPINLITLIGSYQRCSNWWQLLQFGQKRVEQCHFIKMLFNKVVKITFQRRQKNGDHFTACVQKKRIYWAIVHMNRTTTGQFSVKKLTLSLDECIDRVHFFWSDNNKKNWTKAFELTLKWHFIKSW